MEKNFGHPTVESIHVHDGSILLRRTSEYKCEIVNRMTAVYATKLPIPSGKTKEEILTDTLKSLWTTASMLILHLLLALFHSTCAC